VAGQGDNSKMVYKARSEAVQHDGQDTSPSPVGTPHGNRDHLQLDTSPRQPLLSSAPGRRACAT
jgi:hypothetical protein